MLTTLNEGVKIVCDKILENPDITDSNSTASWEARRWMRIADYILENDFGTFREEEIEAVKNAVRDARRKYFTANVLDQVMWDTDPQQNEANSYMHPPIPQTQKEIKREQEEYLAQQEEKRRLEEMSYEYQQGMRGQYGMANGTNRQDLGLGLNAATNSGF